VSIRRRNRLLGIWLATFAVLLMLAAALPELALLPERIYDIPWAAGITRPALDLGWLFIVMLALYVLGFILLTPQEWRWRLVYAIVALWLLAGLIVLLVWLAGDQAIPSTLTPVPLPSVTPTPETAQEPMPEVYEPALDVTFMPPERWVRVIVISSVILLCAAVLLTLLWLFYARQRPFVPPPVAQLATQAQAALDALYAGEDVHDVVLRCYFEMARVLDESQGLRRAETATPREFAARLVALGLPAQPVQTLTRLFEEVRYGRYQADDVVIQQATASLKGIVAACQELV